MDFGVRLNGEWCKSKKALRLAIAETPGRLMFINTSAFHDGPASYTWTELLCQDGMHYLVGPDPYTNRKWYGSIQVVKGGYTVK